MILLFFGFFRHSDKHSYTFDIKSNKYQKYLFLPNIINEDSTLLLNTEDLLNDLANKYESGKIIRVLIDVLGEQKTSDSNQLLTAMNNIKEDKLRYFPFLKPTIENALDKNE